MISYWLQIPGPTVLSAEIDCDVMFCLQNYQGLRIDRLLVELSDLLIRVSSSVDFPKSVDFFASIYYFFPIKFIFEI